MPVGVPGYLPSVSRLIAAVHIRREITSQGTVAIDNPSSSGQVLAAGSDGPDAGGIQVYAQMGQDYGMRLLWSLALLFPILFFCQEMVVRLGAVRRRTHPPQNVTNPCAVKDGRSTAIRRVAR
jgi:hypothetical protein